MIGAKSSTEMIDNNIAKLESFFDRRKDVHLSDVVDGVDVPGHVGRSGEGLSADVALVVRVLVLRLRVNG